MGDVGQMLRPGYEIEGIGVDDQDWEGVRLGIPGLVGTVEIPDVSLVHVAFIGPVADGDTAHGDLAIHPQEESEIGRGMRSARALVKFERRVELVAIEVELAENGVFLECVVRNKVPAGDGFGAPLPAVGGSG